MSAILEVRDLRLAIKTDEGLAKILDHIDFALERGRILGSSASPAAASRRWCARSSAFCPQAHGSRRV